MASWCESGSHGLPGAPGAEIRARARWAAGTAVAGLAAVVLCLVLTGTAGATLNNGMQQLATGSVAPGSSLAAPALDTTKTGISTWAAYSSCNSAASLVPLMSTTAANGATAAVFDPIRQHAPSWDGTRMVWTGQYEAGGLTALKLYMQNTSTSTCTLTVFAASQDSTGISGTVSVANFPTTQQVDCPSCGTQTLTSGTTVALDADSSNRLDLTWWGIWIVGGLLLVLIIQPYWDRLYSWFRLPS